MTITSPQHQHEQGAAESGDSYMAWADEQCVVSVGGHQHGVCRLWQQRHYKHQHEQGAAESGDSYKAWPGWVVCSVCRPPLPTARMVRHLGPALNKQTSTHFVASSARIHMFLVLPLALYHILGAKSFTNTCSRWHLLHQHTCSRCYLPC